MIVKTIHLEGQDMGTYWTRVDRSLCWHGDTDAEQTQRQQLLAGKTVGVASRGGIGGARALTKRAPATCFWAAIAYARGHDIAYLIAWAHPGVIAHLHQRLGIPFWDLPVPTTRNAVEHNTHLVAPPRGFFFRPDSPQLLLRITAFEGSGAVPGFVLKRRPVHIGSTGL